MRSRRSVLVSLMVVGALTLTVALFDWGWLRGPIGWVVSEKTGRRFAITGDLRVELSAQPRITAGGVVLGNAPWGSEPTMAEIGQLALRIDLRELLKGKLVVTELALARPRLVLETSATGERNWQFGSSSEGANGLPGTLPDPSALAIDTGVLIYRDRAGHTELEVALSAPAPTRGGGRTIQARVHGRVAGRDVSIQRLEADLSPEPRIVAEGVMVGNVPWGSRPVMAEIERLIVRVDLEALAAGRLVLPELVLSRPDVLLERGRDGRSNWSVGAASGQSEAPRIGVLGIADGMLRFRDPRQGTDVLLRIATAAPRAGDRQPMMSVQGGGRYRGASFRAEGRVGTLLSIPDVKRAYPVDLRLGVGDTRGTIKGTLTAPLELRGFNVSLDLEGPDLSQLYPFIPVPLPETPPYRLVGRLDRVGPRWTFTGFQGRVGDSDLAGDFSVDLARPRPVLRGDLVSQNLDLDDLAGLLGAPPDPRETASSEQRQRAAARARGDRVLPDRPYQLERLQAANANVIFRGKRLISQGLPLEDLSAHLVLNDGTLVLQPLRFGVAGGRIVASVTMNAKQAPLHTAAEAEVQALDLQRLFPGFRLSQANAGLIGGSARLRGRGDSVAEMLGSASGDVVLSMSSGHVSNLVLELADLDVAESLLLLAGGDRSVPIRCLVADFHAEDGTMTARTLVLDTADTAIVGAGSINLRDETLDLRLTARSKGPSLAALRGPIRVTGRLKQPAVRPAYERMALRVGAAAVLGVLVGPPAAMVPFVELGLTRDSDCQGLIARARARERPPN